MPAHLLARLPRGTTLPPDAWAGRHRLMVRLVWLHVPALLLFGVARDYAPLHVLLDVSPVAALAVVAGRDQLSQRLRAIAVSFGLLTSSAILVHLWGGAIEAHFHFFVMVTILATYEEWVPYLMAIGYVVLHHGAAGAIAPESVFAHAGGAEQPWLWAGVHGAFISALAVANVVSWRLNEDVRGQLRGTDIRRREAELELAHQAHHDGLTGLPNRKLFVTQTEEALADARDGAPTCAVLFVDVDNFKLVNDSLGHIVGDRLLAAVAERMRRVVRPQDVVARFGGDEFAVLVRQVGDDTDARRVADRIAASLRAPVVVDAEQRFVTASIGVRVADPAEDTPDVLLRDADAAMYRAKELGRARTEVFDASLRDEVVERVELERDLRHVLDGKQLVIEYQPIVDLADDGRVDGVEALLRWDHPEHGRIAPLRFVPIAEQTGLIVPIGAWVLRTACRQLVAWDDQLPASERLRVSVNVSPCQLASSSFPSDVATALAEAGLSPERLCLEVTESAVIADLETASRTLEKLKALGVRVAIDDFGVGYSSLNQLRSLPAVDCLKIDRSFVDGLTTGDGDRAIVDAVVRLADALGLTAVAEGVESIEQVGALREMHCRWAQGYHFARPVPAAAIVELLDRQRLGEMAA